MVVPKIGQSCAGLPYIGTRAAHSGGRGVDLRGVLGLFHVDLLTIRATSGYFPVNSGISSLFMLDYPRHIAISSGLSYPHPEALSRIVGENHAR